MKSTLGTIVIALLLATQVGAQDAEKTRPKETRPASPPHGTTSPPQAVTPEQPRAVEGQLANVRIELTITDQRGDAAPVTKTVSMMTADRTPPRYRPAAIPNASSSLVAVVRRMDGNRSRSTRMTWDVGLSGT